MVTNLQVSQYMQIKYKIYCCIHGILLTSGQNSTSLLLSIIFKMKFIFFLTLITELYYVVYSSHRIIKNKTVLRFTSYCSIFSLNELKKKKETMNEMILFNQREQVNAVTKLSLDQSSVCRYWLGGLQMIYGSTNKAIALYL